MSILARAEEVYTSRMQWDWKHGHYSSDCPDILELLQGKHWEIDEFLQGLQDGLSYDGSTGDLVATVYMIEGTPQPFGNGGKGKKGKYL